jgi:hypothetical protein
MKRVIWTAGVAVLMIGLITSTGCGGREFAEVEGTVTLDGAPLTDTQVVFLPDPFQGNQGNTASARTDAEGHYRLQTERDNRDGTVLGPHRVVFVDLLMIVDSTGAAGGPKAVGASAALATLPGTKPRRFPLKYGHTNDTPFQNVDIKSGKQTLDFDLKSKGK